MEVSDNCGTLKSNIAKVVVTPNKVPQVSISSSDTSVCLGEEVTITAKQVNGGGNSSYKFQDETEATLKAEAYNNTYVLSPEENTTVYVLMTPSEQCVTSTSVLSEPIALKVTSLLSRLLLNNQGVNLLVLKMQIPTYGFMTEDLHQVRIIK